MFGAVDAKVRKMETDKKFLEDFIEVYKRHPALWKVKSPLSKNKILRECGINELLAVCKERYLEADKEFVRKKINNLRTAFRRELIKVKKSRKNGCSQADIYTPSLWYYNLLYFTADEIGRPGVNSLKNDGDAANTEVDDFQVLSPDGSNCQFVPPPQPTSRAKRPKSYAQKRNELIDRANEAMKFLESSAKAEDEFSIAGKRFAYQLRAMSEDQRLLAEKIIAEVMYYGSTGKLTENSFPLHNSK